MPIPLSVEVIVVEPCLLCRACIWLREELCTPKLYYPNPQWRFPVWEVLCGRYSENPSVWRRGRRAECSNLEIYLCVGVWSTISNSLSYIVHWLILFISYTCLVCLCAILVLTQRASYSTSTLIQRNQEELVQSPSSRIWLHSLVTLSVLH